jgi:glycosyltransferase involved in cell wall biosynthesis
VIPHPALPIFEPVKFVDLSYYFNRTNNPEQLLEAHAPNLGYFDHLPEDWQCTLVKFAQKEGHIRQPRYEYHYFTGSDSKLWVPVVANKFIAGLKPDVVMVHGLIFPQQVLALKAQLPKRCKILVQHHAERPGKGMLTSAQWLANKYIDGYLFATKELAGPWIEQRLISEEKVFEVMEGSSVMQRMEKADARRHLGLGDETSFLWVGRLDNNKNPQTLLAAFDQFLQIKPGARLYMVYGGFEESHLLMVQHMCTQGLLPDAISLVGKLSRSELAYWYNAADYYISTSFSEGSGYALIEAMSCGCVPVVSDIPSFRKITGDTGYLFDPGNVPELRELLCRLPVKPDVERIAKVSAQFENELSFTAIARQLKTTALHVLQYHSSKKE